MRVLLTNDDGIDSVGLSRLKQFVHSLGFDDLWAVAPSCDKSASGHSVTLASPLKLKKLSEKNFALDGSPADCVIVAMNEIFKNDKKPDFIFSGANIGANVGLDKIYSGTVAAALEGMLFGVPSFAISQVYHFDKSEIKWNLDSVYLKECVEQLLKNMEVLKRSAISINLPYEAPVGFRFIKQGLHKMSNSVKTTKHHNTDKDTKYLTISAECKLIDCKALKERNITVTPIKCDLTDYDALKLLNK